MAHMVAMQPIQPNMMGYWRIVYTGRLQNIEMKNSIVLGERERCWMIVKTANNKVEDSIQKRQ